MSIPRLVAAIFSVGMMIFYTGVVSGQPYPNKPVRIVTAAVGGASDLAARLIAQGLTGPLGQPVIVDNRGGTISIETVAKAAPDGYTVLLSGSANWLLPFLRVKTSYDPVRDFAPITVAVSSPQVLAVHPSLPVKSVKELIALAKSRPGDLNYGSGNSGSSSHLAGELFKAMSGINIVRINYKGTSTAVNALIAGDVQLMITSAAVTPHVKSGRLRALAVTSTQPSALFPGLPTVAASGLPGYEAVAILGVLAPAKTSMVIIDRLNEEIVRLLKTTEVKEKFFNAGVDVVGSSPEEFAAAIKSEMARMGKVIKDAGIREE